MTDALGQPVPAWLEEVFRGREDILRLVDHLEGINQSIVAEGWKPSGEQIQVRKLNGMIEQVMTELMANAPFVVCGRVNHDNQCCKGRQWISAREYNHTHRDGRAERDIDPATGLRKGVLRNTP